MTSTLNVVLLSGSVFCLFLSLTEGQESGSDIDPAPSNGWQMVTFVEKAIEWVTAFVNRFQKCTKDHQQALTDDVPDILKKLAECFDKMKGSVTDTLTCFKSGSELMGKLRDIVVSIYTCFTEDLGLRNNADISVYNDAKICVSYQSLSAQEICNGFGISM